MPEKLVTVRSYFDPVAASMAETYLRNVGISAVLADEKLVSNTWHLANAVQGIKLQVPEPDLAKAVYYLGEIDSARSERLAGDSSPAIRRSGQVNHLDDSEDDDDEFDDEYEDDSDGFEESAHLLPFQGGYADSSEADEDDGPPNQAEANAERAFRGAAFGLIFVPLQFYVTLLLADVYFAGEKLRPRYRRRAIVAAIVNFLFLVLLTFYLRYS